jgi:tetratricopeptide (TPR) repeat protein
MPQVKAICGDSAYLRGNYHEAIALYQDVINDGYESPGLYYNLGNAYFKTNDFTAAVLFYEKALKLDPGHEQARFNIQLANTKIVDKIEPVPLPFYLRAWKKGSELLSLKAWGIFLIAMITLALLSIAFFLITARVVLRKSAFWAALVFLFLFILGNIFAYAQYARQDGRTEAIVFEPALTVKSSPDESSTDLFVVHEGTKVQITDRIGDWSEVRIANGGVGWVMTITLREI